LELAKEGELDLRQGPAYSPVFFRPAAIQP
jgi:hypothetical protein